MMTETRPELKAAWERALTKSRAVDPLLARVRRVACGSYQVSGEHGVYTVTVNADGYSCTCPAGQNERNCYHEASAWRLRCASRMVVAPVASTAQAVKSPTGGPLPDLIAMYGDVR